MNIQQLRLRKAIAPALGQFILRAKSDTAEVLQQNQQLKARRGVAQPLPLVVDIEVSKANQLLIGVLRSSASIYADQIAKGSSFNNVRTSLTLPLWARLTVVEAQISLKLALNNPRTPAWAKEPLRLAIALVQQALAGL
ncbi:hypothetical protein [Marininema halotolerans]|uniref:Uncharacterized protein n=1 Tax=Marininema halotolerans TaxID=1155944 RepID=A0A1I6SFR0_9BACL|nr:hypothetical protein [Marininema halotolerans]SFS75764.1 hypothetical protein SAMN05444972_10750 [Marininema halotolerans]